jgi:hypothetical protein
MLEACSMMKVESNVVAEMMMMMMKRIISHESNR